MCRDAHADDWRRTLDLLRRGDGLFLDCGLIVLVLGG